jgi:hypothetical protein
MEAQKPNTEEGSYVKYRCLFLEFIYIYKGLPFIILCLRTVTTTSRVLEPTLYDSNSNTPKVRPSTRSPYLQYVVVLSNPGKDRIVHRF